MIVLANLRDVAERGRGMHIDMRADKYVALAEWHLREQRSFEPDACAGTCTYRTLPPNDRWPERLEIIRARTHAA